MTIQNNFFSELEIMVPNQIYCEQIIISYPVDRFYLNWIVIK